MNDDISIINNLDISIWGLILQADLVVRIVMLILLFLSIFSWSSIFEKITRIKRLARKAKKFELEFLSGVNIDTLYKSVGTNVTHPMEAIFITGMK